MPRLVFWNEEDFVKWIENRMAPAKYECYFTQVGELILVPTVSTRPIMYAYFMAPTMSVGTTIAELIEHRGVPVYRVKSFEWREEDRVGK
ncbi:MAG: hypothetical protein ACYTFW_09400 [Planctomycetota bacterium]|jgi:hypothetical protein